MAKTNNVETSNVRVRPNNADENRVVLKEILARKEVDERKQEELGDIFDRINAECAARSLREKRKALASPDKQEKVIKTVHYGPLPGLSSGTWWGIRMDCSRDFVHEPFHDHIHDGPYGAVSVCTSHLNPHSDVDLGDILTFTSRDYSANDHSKDSLILSYKNRVPIRLVRSYSLSNEYAPKTGYRYDGLYTVVYYWIGVSADSTKHRKFVLTRVKDQEPPPWMAKTSNSSKAAKSKKSTTPRLTRSHTNVSSQEPKKKKKFVFKKIEKEAPKVGSAIVSRQVFQKFIPGSPDSSPKAVSSMDSESQSSCPNACPTKLCNTNLSIRTNLYNSQSQNLKKTAPMTMCKLFRSNQSVHACQKNSDDEISKVSTSETSDSESTDKNSSLNCSTSSECKEKKVKKVTWADNTTSSNNHEKSPTQMENGFQYSSCGVIDGFCPTSPKKCGVLKCNNNTKELLSTQTSKPNNILNSSTKPSQHIVQVHSRSTVPQPPKSSFSETETMDDEPSSNIDTLAPDKLVNAIVKEKFHPMAKLLIGNMIGLENQESSILNAYNTLTSKTDQDDTKQSKENKLRNKFYMKNNKSRKNGMLKRQRREIANLMIDAKFNNTVTRASTRNNRHLRTTKMKISKSELPQRKIMNARRIQSRNLNMDIRVRDLQSQQQQQPKKDRERPGKRKAEDLPSTTATTTTMMTRTKRPKMVTMWTQCTLLAPSTVDQGVQVGGDCVIMEEDIKVEELDEPEVIKQEPGDAESSRDAQEASTSRVQPRRSYISGSAFAAVNTVDSGIRIARLRSIGFRPIRSSTLDDEDSNGEFSRPDVDEEYNKYANDETDIVGYMDEQLHFEDIEEEEEEEETPQKQSRQLLSPRPIESLTEEDFDRPWHGWKKVTRTNGQEYWTGY